MTLPPWADLSSQNARFYVIRIELSLICLHLGSLNIIIKLQNKKRKQQTPKILSKEESSDGSWRSMKHVSGRKMCSSTGLSKKILGVQLHFLFLSGWTMKRHHSIAAKFRKKFRKLSKNWPRKEFDATFTMKDKVTQ